MTPKNHKMIYAPISLGELVDKISILKIKEQHLQGEARENVLNELSQLEDILKKKQPDIDTKFSEELARVNHKLWNIEDKIRECEYNKDFGNKFIQLARSVYTQNDKRGAIERKINEIYKSELIEEKRYQSY